MNNKKYALISVFDKKNLLSICKIFDKFKITIISTGSTATKINELGFRSKLVSDFTNFPEILDGRVKTLHPKLHASLLYNRTKKEHSTTFKKLMFPQIDFVIVNLYPFSETVKSNVSEEEIIEMIDIGGTAILRSSAKNFNFITTISEVKDYKIFIENIKKNNGNTSMDFRKGMAKKVFSLTSSYDRDISNWFKSEFNKLNKKIPLKYGENPNQKSSYILNKLDKSLFRSKIQGKDLGYNNIQDLDAGINCINEFNEPTCVVIKHNNPCGVASNKDINKAFKDAIAADSLSAYGGIVVLNKVVDEKLAVQINKKFFEIVAAKKFSIKAKEILKKKKKLILIETLKLPKTNTRESKSTIGGILTQEKNLIKIKVNDLNNVTKKTASQKIKNDLVFALKVCKHVKSNAIVLAKNQKTIGIGAGQMSRIDSTKIAILKSKIFKKTKNFVAASDAFFPFTDSIKILFKNNCHSVVQPKGSINDNKIIAYANKKGICLYFINFRLFKH